MRGALLPLLALALLALALLAVPDASAQAPTATATLDVPEPPAANGTAVVPFTLTLSVSGFLCTEDATFTVAVTASNTTLPVTLHPQTVEFVVPAGQDLSGYTQSRAVALAVGAAPPGTTETLRVVAGAPAGGCVEAFAAERSGDAAEVTVLWPMEPEKPPGQAMPGPHWAAVLAAVWAPGWFSRRMGLNSPRP